MNEKKGEKEGEEKLSEEKMSEEKNGEKLSEEDVGEEELLEKEALNETLQRAVRGKQAGDFERLLASNLAAAVFAPPLEKIRLVLEAFLLLPEEGKESIAVEEGEQEKIRELYEVAVSLSGMVEVPSPYPAARGRFAQIPWSFPLNHAHRYLSLFMKGSFNLTGYVQQDEWVKLEKRLDEGDESAWEKYYVLFAGYLASGFAPLATCKMVETEFCTCVMPYVLQLLREMFTAFISPKTWTEMLSIMKQGEGE